MSISLFDFINQIQTSLQPGESIDNMNISVRFIIEYPYDSDDNAIIQEPIKNTLSHLPKYTRINNSDFLLLNNASCSICFDNYKSGEYKRHLHKCNHVFHKKCIDKWLKTTANMECPVCRTSYCPSS